MRTLLALFATLTLVSACALHTGVTPYAVDIESTFKHIAPLTDASGIGGCTAIAVGPELYVSVDHCNSPLAMFIGNQPATLLRKIGKVLVFKSSFRRIPLRLEPRSVRVGDPVFAVGYAATMPYPSATFGRVSTTQEGIFGQPVGITIYGNLIPGMSGGPVFDRYGWMVGMTELGGAAVSPYHPWGYALPLQDVIAALVGLQIATEEHSSYGTNARPQSVDQWGHWPFSNRGRPCVEPPHKADTRPR